MNFKELQEMFNSSNKIKFKLYSLEYVIESKDNEIIVYALDYSGRKEKFKSFKEAMNNYKIYSEPIINQMDKMELLDNNE